MFRIDELSGMAKTNLIKIPFGSLEEPESF